MMSTIPFTLLIVGILLSGLIIGFIAYKISPKKNNTLLFCNNNQVLAKFDNMREHEISIDEVVDNFELLDI